MSGIQVNLANWDALLMEDYVIGEIEDAVDKSTIFKNKLKRSGTIDGRRRIYPISLTPHQGVGSRGEGQALPESGAGEYLDVIVDTKYHYARFSVTGQAESYSSRKSFVEAGMRSLKDTKEALTLHIGRGCWSDGSGTLGLINNGGGHAIGVATLTVDSAYGVLWGSLAGNTTFLFKKNMKLQIGTDTNGGVGYKITSVTATTIVITPALTTAAADNARIYVLGSKDLEIEGYLKLVGTSSFMTSTMGLANDTYHNIDRSDNPDWAGNVTDAGAALSLVNIRGIKDTMYKRGGVPELGITSTEVVRDFEAILSPLQRFVPAVKLSGGATTLEHDGLTFTKDKDAPVKALAFATPSHIEWAERGKPNWQKQGDSIMRVIPGFDMSEAVLRWYSNLDCDRPRAQGLLYNLTVS